MGSNFVPAEDFYQGNSVKYSFCYCPLCLSDFYESDICYIVCCASGRFTQKRINEVFSKKLLISLTVHDVTDPHNALYICKTLGVDPSQTVMVGDTPADTLMGQEVG